MRKLKMIMSILLAVVLCCVSVVACAKQTDEGGSTKKDPKPQPPAQPVHNWTIEAINQTNETTGDIELTTGLKFTFLSNVVSSFGVENFTINGNAVELDYKTDILTGEKTINIEEVQPLQYTVPIFSKYDGQISVSINIMGITTMPQIVNVQGEYELPQEVNYLNKMGIPESYQGTPFVDESYPYNPDLEVTSSNYMPPNLPNSATGQKIPGKVFCAYYDEGGNNIAFKDSGANAGSGALNPGNAYKNAFRKGNPIVDTSYLKGFYQNGKLARTNGDIVDFHTYNMVYLPEEWQNTFYVGWTGNSEWFRNTVDVETTGLYEVRMLYTNTNALYTETDTTKFAQVSIDFDPTQTIVSRVDPTTRFDFLLQGTKNPNDKTSWRQGPHHWNYCIIGYVYLQQGQGVMTTRLNSKAGGGNYCFYDFSLVETVA